MKKILLLIAAFFLFRTDGCLRSAEIDPKSIEELVTSIASKSVDRQKDFALFLNIFINACMEGNFKGVLYICNLCSEHKQLLYYLTTIYVNQTLLKEIVLDREFNKIVAIFEEIELRTIDIDEYQLPLLAVVKQQNYDKVLSLLEYRPDVYQTNDFSEKTALHFAVISQKESIVTLLLRYSKEGINKQDLSGQTALFVATSLKNEKIVAILLASGAGPNIANINGVTPLHVAATYGYDNIVEQLLIHGVNLDLKDTNGYTALDRANEMSQTGIKNYLFLAGWGLDIYQENYV
ncbi:ankyrin repeat domain-containing protein [Candidatus Babeliales bacterium]|nr:ankyrin repeat domain-containing protein [Candidatus Babeliales bacterium]